MLPKKLRTVVFLRGKYSCNSTPKTGIQEGGHRLPSQLCHYLRQLLAIVFQDKSRTSPLRGALGPTPRASLCRRLSSRAGRGDSCAARPHEIRWRNSLTALKWKALRCCLKERGLYSKRRSHTHTHTPAHTPLGCSLGMANHVT